MVTWIFPLQSKLWNSLSSHWLPSRSCGFRTWFILFVIHGSIFNHGVSDEIFQNLYFWWNSVRESFKTVIIFFCFRKILHKLKKMTTTIFPLFFTLFSIFYIFSYVAKSMYNRDAPQYFGTLSGSMFTMFQVNFYLIF
jgi:hypothetical protein